MKEILFRGECLDVKGIAYGYLKRSTILTHGKKKEHFFIGNDESDIYNEGNEYREVDPETVGQFTGLKDKNGKEIYEGDIILCKRKGELVPYKVYIDEETQQQSIISIDEEGDLEGLYDYHFDCQIIGNIYENPELIK